jgi:hypothetical protein
VDHPGFAVPDELRAVTLGLSAASLVEMFPVRSQNKDILLLTESAAITDFSNRSWFNLGGNEYPFAKER